MPEFRLRIWQEQVLFDCNDYVVEADTLEAAVALLRSVQAKADDVDRRLNHDNIRACHSLTGGGLDDEVAPLDPEEIVSGDSGVTLLDENGERERDLISVPTGCVQLGEPLDVPDEDEEIAP